jgi:hypothetical protein
LSGDALLLFVADLSHFTDEQIRHGLARCRAEIKPMNGFVAFNVAVVLETMGVVCGESREKAEAALAWEAISKTFYVCSECDFQHCSVEISRLTPRGRAAFRMIGGVRRIQGTYSKDIHFIQRDFLAAHALTEDIENMQLLPPKDSPAGELLAELARGKRIDAKI